MISAKRFAISEPVLFKATQDFVQSFAEVPDPIIYISSKARSLQAKIAWTILGSAIFQDIEYTDVMRMLVALYKSFPEDKLWTLPVPKEEEILAVADQVLQGKSWSLKEHLPGIFWSVGNFVRHHQTDGLTTGKTDRSSAANDAGLELWATSRTAEEIWRDLGEVYFMGKSKPRPKAVATIYRFTEESPRGLGIALKPSRGKAPIPLSMGMRRYLSILGPGKYVKFSEFTAEEKQKAGFQLLLELSPANPMTAAHGLQFFLEKGSREFICKDHFKTCKKCPLYKFCKYAV
ncbi:MAG: hypothetical protein MJY87_04295 [Fibrobacter sp.]|nr:hypothetical protein [Fibrobacter sp.]